MSEGPGPAKLRGIVEADEAYIGGKPRKGAYFTRNKKVEKVPVFAAVERGGRVRARPMERVTAHSVGPALIEFVDDTAEIHTDESSVYRWLDSPWLGGHQSVNHSAREYARGPVTTNSVEGFFSLLKRGIYGTFHSVSKEHLHRYVDEFTFRYNTRELDDGERTLEAIRNAEGKRLLHRG